VKDRREIRSEHVIFDDLRALCASPGYAHVLAYMSCRDNVIMYSGQMLPKDMEHLYSHEHLIRTEIATLIGLLVKGPLDLSRPTLEVMDAYLKRTEVLMQDLHEVLSSELFSGFDLKGVAEGRPVRPLSGAALREPIFYGGESAYSFQYRDFAPLKYAQDIEWLRANKGFSVDEARAVVQSIVGLQEDKLRVTLEHFSREHTLLPGLIFSAIEVAERGDLDLELVRRVLQALSVPSEQRNDGFRTLSDFNVVNAFPLIPTGAGEFILFQYYNLVEALYETPFYWMGADRAYAPKALRHRGSFTEEFSTARLESVFGQAHVFRDVKVFDAGRHLISDIDVLVLFGDRAIVVQAKSKRLTIEARKGQDRVIRDDFKKSVQDAYDQGLKCARALTAAGHEFRVADSKHLAIPKLREIFILCVVADHYPALNYQVAEFLNASPEGLIQAPLVLDVFALDAMAEMLASPLQFLSYIKRRTGYAERVFSGHELTILSYHLRKNLWVDEDITRIYLGDDIATDLDIAMAARRDNIPGKRTPDGLLTRLPETEVGKVIASIEAKPDPRTIELGFALLTLSEDAVLQMSDGIDRIVKMAARDGRAHDFTAGIADGRGITVHCNDDPLPLAMRLLEVHCEKRKFMQKAEAWFGICLSPREGALRFGVNLQFPWKPNPQMDAAVANVQASIDARKRKIGRNEPCFCGSGKKYKKCCIGES
jgi:hypothetical protein